MRRVGCLVLVMGIGVLAACGGSGSDATAPHRNATPSAISRATLGASPDEAMSYSTFGLQPSNRNPTT